MRNKLTATILALALLAGCAGAGKTITKPSTAHSKPLNHQPTTGPTE